MESQLVTDSERQLLQQFRICIQDLNLSKDSAEDKNLVRWLRARNNKLKDAEVMLRGNIRWRQEKEIDKLAGIEDSKFFPPGWEEYFTCVLYGFDKDDGPFHILSAKTWDIQKAVNAGLRDEIINYCFGRMEKAWRICVKNSKGKEFIPQFTSIYDMRGSRGITFSQLSSMEALNGLLEVCQALDTNYPECLKCLFLLNAPWIFQMLWKLLCQILSEKTTSRMVFLGGNKKIWREEISKLVPLNQFPKMYGGDGDDNRSIPF